MNGATLSITDAASSLVAQPPPLVTGQESDAELRERIIQLSQRSEGRNHEHGRIFAVLGGLSHATLNNLVNGMNRSRLLALFEREDEEDGPPVA